VITFISIAVFWTVQASALLAFRVPFAWPMIGLWAVSHFLRAIGLTLAFHRYFAHRAFQMNRGARFAWALIGTAAMQKGPLWWAGHHVNHHKFADRDGDPHSPSISGVYHAHIGWFLNDARHDRLEPTNVVLRDFSTAPEIVWLDRYHVVPPLALAAALYLLGGLQWLVWGFCVPTVTLAHSTFAINSINHLFGSRRFDTIDDSRNNALTAFFAAGEGWHNNHHRYQSATRNGFFWWEIDITYYLLKCLSWTGLIWGLKSVPASVLAEGERSDHHDSVAAAQKAQHAHPEYSSLKRIVPAAAAIAVATVNAAHPPSLANIPDSHREVSSQAQVPPTGPGA
jgi:stearoyl-CoA desaturase (delta-9 desaturase)